MLYYWWG